MTQPIDTNETRHVAELARLELTDEELARITKDLGDILDYVRELESVDTSDVPAMTHAVDLPTRWREDEICPSLDVDLSLRDAPERLGDGFGVPKIIE